MKAKIWNSRKWIKTSETDNHKISQYFKTCLLASGFKILGELEYVFTPQGYTMIFLLAESHFAIHTFPEHKKIYIELSSCNKEKYKAFKKSVDIKKNLC